MGNFFGKTLFVQAITLALVALFASTTVWAQGPIDFLRNIGKSVEADPKKEYMLTEMEGPYLIHTAAFSGQNARQEAHSLVLELRKSYKWNAFVHEMTFAFDASQDFREKVRNPYTGTVAKYRNPGGGTEFAVVIGNFSSLDDKQLEKTLADVRKCQPASLKGKGSPFPFSMAFPLPNPLMPPVNHRLVVDPFIESINKGRPYTLLRNQRRYTVQIATFTGQIVQTGFQAGPTALDKLPSNDTRTTKLEKGEQAAIMLCETLRKRGIEAYEFHDRYGSIVTVGGFDQHSRQMPNGTVELDPLVLKIVQQYQGQVINGIECDKQPRVIEVPRSRR